MSNTRKNFSSDIQTLRSWLKNTRLRLVLSTHFSVFLSLNLSFRTMAISTHEEPYMKYFGRRFENLSYVSTYEDVKELYDEYAEAYDKVKA